MRGMGASQAEYQEQINGLNKTLEEQRRTIDELRERKAASQVGLDCGDPVLGVWGFELEV